LIAIPSWRILARNMRPPGATTVGRESTAGGRGGPTVLAIRWLFPELDGRLTVFEKRPLVLGREDDVDVALPSEQTSRRHAEVQLEGLVARIRDLDSRNGLHVDGKRVKEAHLTVGSLIRLGEWVGVVVAASREELADEDPFQPLLPGYFGGPVLRAALEPLRKAAASDLPVIVQGETGAGKEGVARAVHAWSGRPGPFLAVNCAALPEAMAEGELFGYRRGAFTGADRANPGYLRATHTGTLFLDEIADLSPALQPKLLRALEQREVVPLGESAPVRVDVRIVAAVQAPLREAVEAKRFRGDLFARLDGVTVPLPPLRERVQEIPFLFMNLLTKGLAGRPRPSVDSALIERLCLYDWPFNVRELDLVTRQVVALHGDQKKLLRTMLPSRFLEPAATAVPVVSAPSSPTPDLETLLGVLRKHDGNISRAAAQLGISRQKAYRLMEGAPRPGAPGEGADATSPMAKVPLA
jgi:transcriptional regulator of acetoin/glycerol metabolism